MLSLFACALVLRAENPRIDVAIQGRGTFVIELYPAQAPKLVSHVLGLVDKRFYDGMLIHRKVPDFVVQTGDPLSKKVSVAWARKHPGDHGGTKGLGDGGSGKSVPFEINDLTHEKYAVGM